MRRARIAFALTVLLLALGGAAYVMARGPWFSHDASRPETHAAKGVGPIIYYRDPDGPFFSPAPRKNPAGKDYVAVRASEDVSFDEKPWAAAEPAQQQSSGRRILYYRNPMGLPDTSPVPKKDPMGMDYAPVYEDEAQDASTVTISPGKLQKTGVRSEPVERRELTIPIRAAGRVDFDPRRTSVVALRFEGFIESVGKVAEGDYVRKGQTLMRVYGPDLSSAAAEYVAVLTSGPAARMEGARRRLVNLGLDDATIAAIARSRRVPRAIDWPAPQGGHVIERAALSGMRAAPGETLFRIVDHSLVWVLADVAERDVSAIKPGEPAIIRVRSYPDRPFKGQVALVYPHLNMETRTARVRIELPNPDGLLLGDMFADVEIEGGGKQKVLAVPESAIIDAGKRQVVILDKGEGRFQPREVQIGRRGEGLAEITSGVAEGERVVTAANFLIDAESNLKAALQALDQGQGR
ncbi:MAG: efflux RND transporter periplasmic adaptor subunit [Methylocystis sp.]|uniref:efflux RND transporter periplasmic adaptor subunit n=1 Tax=Methylocystis sp. TaxID=1911079 RepID=UPI003DA44F8A